MTKLIDRAGNTEEAGQRFKAENEQELKQYGIKVGFDVRRIRRRPF